MQVLLLKLVPKQTSIYFLTSRTAAIRAGVESEQDIETIDKMKFSGSVEENLKERFGILPKNNLDRQTEQDGLQAYKAVILKSAKKARRNYKTYINKLHIQKGEIAFFDFVAKGTVQMYVQRLINYHLKGFYFLRLESEQTEEKNLDIQAFYTKEKKEGTIIFDCYYILETLLTSPFPSVQQFNKKGKPIYAKETRTEQQMRCLQKMQNGVWEYFKTYLALCPVTQRMEQKELDETLLSFIHKFCITDEDFLHMVMMCANYGNLETEVRNLEEGGIDSFHIDIMDGRFVPNFAMSLNDLTYIADTTKTPIDIHLMIEHPNNNIQLFLDHLRVGDTVYIHPEAEYHPSTTLQKVINAGMIPGIAINPGTSVETVFEMLRIVKKVLVMSVNPGNAGQMYLPYVGKKIIKLLSLKEDMDFEIYWDGACSADKIMEYAPKGVKGFVLGTTLLFGRTISYQEIIKNIRHLQF